jgi:multicomponent Na+:H+ antiporter subunit G
MTALVTISNALVLLGTLFCVVGGIGMLRLPDVYCRMHAAGITDTLGAGLVLLGLTLQGGLSITTVKLVTILIFLWLTSPASTHALGKAAYAGGFKVEGTVKEGGARGPD